MANKTAATKTASQQLENFLSIPIASIVPSPTNPRKYFDPDKLNELAENIKIHGVKSPVMVRKNGKEGKFELIFGERRLKASAIAGLDVIPAQLVEMDDAEVLNVQITENLQRDDLHPLDEAMGYAHLLKTVPGMTIAEIAQRIGKSEKYVHQRLKLHSLIPEASEDLAKGHLHLSHALEIARLAPESQMEALVYSYDEEYNFKYQGKIINKDELVTLADLKDFISSHILLNLSKAPFKLDDSTLREDGLICQTCEHRSGNSPALFADLSKGDYCTNRVCFEGKIQTFVQIKRAGISIKANKGEEYEAPLIHDYWSNDNGILGRDSYKAIDSKKEVCEFAETAIYGKGHDLGKTQLICRNTACKTHFNQRGSSSSSSSSGSSTTKSDPAINGKRKQELFDIKVAETVRQKVLRFFYETLDVKEDSLPLDRSYIELIAAKQWQKLEGYQKTLILELLSEVFNNAKDFPYDFEKLVKRFQQFSTKVLMRFMVLCSIIHYGENRYGNSWEKQDDVIKLAADHNIDYILFDAQERVAQSPKKHKWDAERYLKEIEESAPGSKIEKPEVWESPAQVKRLKSFTPSLGAVKKSAAETNTPVQSRAAKAKKSRKGGKQ